MRSKEPNEPDALTISGGVQLVVPENEGEQGNEIAEIVNKHPMFNNISELSSLNNNERIDIVRLRVLAAWHIRWRSMYNAYMTDMGMTGRKPVQLTGTFAKDYVKVRGNSKEVQEKFIEEFRKDNLETRRSLKGIGATQAVIVATRGLYQSIKRRLLGGRG